MPALTNNRFGSSWISGAEGTTVWPFFSKNASQRRRISAVSMGNQSSGVMGATGHGHATSYAGPRRWVGRVRAGCGRWEGGGAPAPTELARRWGRAAAPGPPRASASGPGRRPPARMPGWPRRAPGCGPSRPRRRGRGSRPTPAWRGARLVASVSTATSTASRSSASRRAEASLKVVTKRWVTGSFHRA